MVLSIWRYSHFILAISSAIFLLLASITGIILAIQPISEITRSAGNQNIENIRLNQLLAALQSEYSEILDVEVTPSKAVKTSVITKEGENKNIYIHPVTAKEIGEIEKVSPIFKWTTNLHRSLFLKSVGRFFVGLVSLLLCMIAITGGVLVIKRQGGVLKLFSRVKETSFNERYHVILGRLFLIPIFIIAGTGVYLSLEKFSLLPEYSVSHTYKDVSAKVIKNNGISEFPLFKEIKLNKVKKLNFPFSSDVEDYFELALKDKELLIQQYTGEIISEVPYPFVKLASQLSLKLHTGSGSILWSLILIMSCLGLLFFIYSGIFISIKRIKKSKLEFKNIDKDECDIVLLVGSETGNTFLFAKHFCKGLIQAGKKVHLSSLNGYTTYEKATQLIVFTSTYGDGEAPSNAKHFESTFNNVAPINKMQFSVVGFGSKLYDKYCNYAVKAETLLQGSNHFKAVLPLAKINDQSQLDFNTWVQSWSSRTNLKLQLNKTKKKIVRQKFRVLRRTILDSENTFILELEPVTKMSFQSGDLLSITPKNENRERLYSIGRVDDKIVLSIKKHCKGKCSTQLSELQPNDILSGTIKPNPHFHFPNNTKTQLLIANGTGIAPFLGMLNEDHDFQTKTYLFWGGRTKNAFQTYSNLVDRAYYNGNLSGLFLNYSREENQRRYVQNSLLERKELVINTLKEGGVIMICGSLIMLKDTLDVLNQITLEELKETVETYKSNKQILTDCY